MFNGPFRSYQEASTQQCMQDLMDGYFPSELQDRFADGVPFQVHDRREEEFQERRPWAEFPGKGQAVVGCTEGEKLTDSLEHAYCRKMTMDQFLNRLPKVVVKAGRVIDIRDSVKASLQVRLRSVPCPVLFHHYQLSLPHNFRWTDATAYDIISAFPQRWYSEDSQTLLSCGLTPNAALLLRTRPGPRQ
uniref:UBX domain-containing protein 11 n=1 Tax=Oncorhynchus mykiss TaxID=8022 RepID=A0A8C7T409_ONCMY